MPVISLGSRSFTGPFLAPVWTPPRAAGLYAVMVPGWRLLTFHPVHVGHAGDLAYAGLLRGHDSYAEWLALAGTEWNLYVAACEMPGSGELERQAACRELSRTQQTITIRGPSHAQL
jgi:hypothetical protein